MNTRHAYVETILGQMLLVASDALIGAYFEGHTYPPAPETIGELTKQQDDALLAQATKELREYLAGQRQMFDVPLRASGDAFSERVWRRLSFIPFGETTSYGALAAELGNAALAQRVGQAVGHNPICIFVPCHRVLGADGSLTGYAGGLDRKRKLLSIEELPVESTDRLF